MTLGLSVGCSAAPEKPSATAHISSQSAKAAISTQPVEAPTKPVSEEAQTESSQRAEATEPTQVNGLYFYGESPTPEEPGKKYLFFRQDGNHIIGWESKWHTDDRSCLQGQRNGDMITDISTAIAPIGPEESWWFVPGGAVDLNDYYQLPNSPLPDIARELLETCTDILNERSVVEQSPTHGLSAWVGHYTFGEYNPGPPAPLSMSYGIDLLDGTQLSTGKVTIDGHMTAKRMMVEVRPEGPDRVGLYLQAHTGELNVTETWPEPGDLLLQMETLYDGQIRII